MYDIVLLRTPSAFKHIREVRLGELDAPPFLDFRVEDPKDEDFLSLVASIQKHGLLQPVIVRPSSKTIGSLGRSRCELVCGHRRYEACRRLGFESIPCIVMDLDDRGAFEVALVENVQKRTLDPVEEAEAFKSYVTLYGRGSVTRLAERICKSEEYVSHRLLMLGLPKPLLDRISRRLLNPSHAMELVWLRNAKEQLELSEEITKHNLSLRQLRSVIKLVREGTPVWEATQTVLQTRDLEMPEAGAGVANTSQIRNEPWIDNSIHTEASDSGAGLDILNRAILVMKSALAGMDFLIGDEQNLSALELLIRKERREVHTILDEIISAKVTYKKCGTIQSPAA
jgi:ParB family chromosome partitioning protein